MASIEYVGRETSQVGPHSVAPPEGQRSESWICVSHSVKRRRSYCKETQDIHLILPAYAKESMTSATPHEEALEQ